jgi:putative glutamine amidotransferase
MNRPLIGIEVDLEATASGRRYSKCYETYFDAVVAAGGAPVLVPPSPAEVQEQVLARLDGLIVPGGDDFHAEEWGEVQRPCERYAASDPRRLDAGKRLVAKALELGRPYLGICYGMQLLPLLAGGALVQDIPDEVEGPLPHSGPPHPIEVAAGTLLARLTGAGTVQVNSRHHQAVREPGLGYVVCARAPDGVVEAIESTSAPFVLGVQWHAEELGDAPAGAPLFEGLVEAARAGALAR